MCRPVCDAENRVIQVQGIDSLAAACETTMVFRRIDMRRATRSIVTVTRRPVWLPHDFRQV